MYSFVFEIKTVLQRLVFSLSGPQGEPLPTRACTCTWLYVLLSKYETVCAYTEFSFCLHVSGDLHSLPNPHSGVGRTLLHLFFPSSRRLRTTTFRQCLTPFFTTRRLTSFRLTTLLKRMCRNVGGTWRRRGEYFTFLHNTYEASHYVPWRRTCIIPTWMTYLGSLYY